MMQTLLKILFPQPCVSCGFLEEALCERCHHALKLDLRVRQINGLKTLSCMPFEEKSLLQRLIHPFKYKHQSNLFRHFVPHLRAGLQLIGDKHALLVPVPLHGSRLHERGYNQVELMVKWLAKDLGLDWAPLLKRTRDTGHQARLSTRLKRLNNMRSAFATQAEVDPTRHIILVDDIVTSGATLVACRDALRRAGAQKISALTLASRE